MTTTAPQPAAELAGAQVDPQLVTALAEAIERLADSALPKPWADLLGAYGLLIRAEMGGALGMPPADFSGAIETYSRAVYVAASATKGE